jgi:DNA primase
MPAWAANQARGRRPWSKRPSLPEGAEIVAAFDADEAGRKLVDVIRQAVASVASRTKRTDLIFKAHLPMREGDDWNQVLQSQTCQNSNRQGKTNSCPG